MASIMARSQSTHGAMGRKQLRSRQQVRVQASADNQLLKKPDQRKPDEPEPARKLFSESPAAGTPVPSAAAVSTSGQGITIEYQRQRAKEMRAYYIEQKAQEAIMKAQVFGWTAKNEISNGRWVMFGLMVGMLTEYATGVDFVHQIALMGSYLGIVETD